MTERKRLTELAVKQLKPADKIFKKADAEGLYIEVHPNGAKYWRLKYRYFGKEKRLALGVYPDVSLAQAREETKLAKTQLAQHIDPSQFRQEAKLAKRFALSNTFADIGNEFIEKRQTEGAAPVTIDKTRWIIHKKLNPFIGKLPISEITPVQLLTALREMEAAGNHETANRAKRVAGQVIRYAISTGRADRDVSAMLQGALITPKVANRAAITDPKLLAAFLKACDAFEGTIEVKTALQLTPMLFQRPGEMRQMEWSELDLANGLWEIPASKMKMREAHIVPLPHQAIALIENIKPITGKGVYVFPSARKDGKPLSENGVRTAMRKMGFPNSVATPHGFRATARTLLDEVLKERVEYIEQQLAHAVKDANGRAYNRTKHLDERRRMMQRWADYLDGLKQGIK